MFLNAKNSRKDTAADSDFQSVDKVVDVVNVEDDGNVRSVECTLLFDERFFTVRYHSLETEAVRNSCS